MLNEHDMSTPHAQAPGIAPVRVEVPARTPCRQPCQRRLFRLRFITDHTKSVEVVAGLYRETLPEYPEPAAREAIVNALAHRDYGLAGATVDITVGDHRIEVRSPGSLPGHIDLENVRTEHYSRNPRITRVLKTLGVVEEYGEGIERIHREMESRLMEPPVFDDRSGSVTVTLSGSSFVTPEEFVWLRQLDRMELSGPERRVLVIARRRGPIARREVAPFLPGRNPGAVLAAMLRKGLLSRVGRRGGTRYALSPTVIRGAGAPPGYRNSDPRTRLLEVIRRRGSMSSREGANRTGLPRHAVLRLLNELVREGALRAEGNTRARRYYLP